MWKEKICRVIYISVSQSRLFSSSRLWTSIPVAISLTNSIIIPRTRSQFLWECFVSALLCMTLIWLFDFFLSWFDYMHITALAHWMLWRSWMCPIIDHYIHYLTLYVSSDHWRSCMWASVISLSCLTGKSVYLTYFECGDAQTIISSRFNCVKGLHVIKEF